MLIYYHTRACFTKGNRQEENSIAIFPYYPKDWAGNSRLAGFSAYFNKDNIKCVVFDAWQANELNVLNHTKSLFIEYETYYKLLIGRLRLLKDLPYYKFIYIQRAFIPMFPYKHAYFERLAKRYNQNIIMDFYDADYESNYNAVFEAIKSAKMITVASHYLYNKFLTTNSNIKFIRLALSDEMYHKKGSWNDDPQKPIRIGWMGSPGNAGQLTTIENQLKAIEDEFNVVFSFVCRDLPQLSLSKAEHHNWDEIGFDYYEWLLTIDIGIVPFTNQTERTKAKISMKGLEFMATGIPMVISPYVHSDKLINNESCLVAKNDEWTTCLSKLIKNNEIRTRMGSQAYCIYKQFHTYNSIYSILKESIFAQ